VPAGKAMSGDGEAMRRTYAPSPGPPSAVDAVAAADNYGLARARSFPQPRLRGCADAASCERTYAARHE